MAVNYASAMQPRGIDNDTHRDLRLIRSTRASPPPSFLPYSNSKAGSRRYFSLRALRPSLSHLTAMDVRELELDAERVALDPKYQETYGGVSMGGCVGRLQTTGLPVLVMSDAHRVQDTGTLTKWPVLA